MQYAFYFDPSRCMQCFSCQVACKLEHSLRPRAEEEPGAQGPRYREVLKIENLMAKEVVSVEYVSIACMHCGSAPCLAACPTGAIYREQGYGVVLVNPDLCIGCRNCLSACPFGAPQFDQDGLMQKCDLCIDRLKEGRQPACVEYCCGGAIKAGPVEEIESEARRRAAGRIVSAARPRFVMGASR